MTQWSLAQIQLFRWKVSAVSRPKKTAASLAGGGTKFAADRMDRSDPPKINPSRSGGNLPFSFRMDRSDPPKTNPGRLG